MSPLIAPAPAWATSTGLLLVRLVVGAAFILHGWSKMQNPFGWMNGMDIVPPGIIQATGAVIEVVCGDGEARCASGGRHRDRPAGTPGRA